MEKILPGIQPNLEIKESEEPTNNTKITKLLVRPFFSDHFLLLGNVT